MTIDLVNSSFEAVFAVLVWGNVRRLLLDRLVEGVSLWVHAFGCLYGLWACVYYACLGHWWSLAGQVAMVAGNVTWLLLALAYRHRSA